jgi:dipeptidyl aminopeptidase/acylaminoacyl peptidase
MIMKLRLLAVSGVLVCQMLHPAIAAGSVEPYPLEYFALREVINSVQISPDGKSLALLKIATRDGNPVLEVYDASNLQKDPFRVNADPMEIRTINWASDTSIVFTARQKVRDKIEGFNQGVYETRLAVLDTKLRKIRQFDEINPQIENVLPNKPDKVILSFFPGSEDNGRIAEAFRPRAYYEFDLKKGTKKLLIRGKLDLGNIDFNGDGDPWAARGFDEGTDEFIWYIRRPGTSGWEEIFRMSEDSYETFVLENIDTDQQDSVIVMANNGDDKAGFWSYSINDKAFKELIYRRNDVDVFGVRYHSNRWTNPDTIVGLGWYKDELHFEYLNEIEGATYAQLESLIPNAEYLLINSRSRDGEVLTIYNEGAHDPGTYYLLKDGRLVTVGSKQPLIQPENLADVRYITYKARDGKSIPAFITIPHGEPPFPTIVMPHGGPFVQETVIYDEWSQMFANNGYLVLQPQYRGSQGYGNAFYLAAIDGGGQGGYKMQDDKDDGALYLVEQGLADPERLALYGWSYGGYAALVAASRTPQIYQCVIAGAAVSDTIMQVNYYRDQLRGHGRDQQLNMWTDSISPVREVEKVNVPILLIHGSVDQRVPPAHAKKYAKALEDNGKSFEYVELEGADHFYDTLYFEHQIKLYESMIDYLKNDCGPGGL